MTFLLSIFDIGFTVRNAGGRSYYMQTIALSGADYMRNATFIAVFACYKIHYLMRSTSVVHTAYARRDRAAADIFSLSRYLQDVFRVEINAHV